MNQPFRKRTTSSSGGGSTPAATFQQIVSRWTKDRCNSTRIPLSLPCEESMNMMPRNLYGYVSCAVADQTRRAPTSSSSSEPSDSISTSHAPQLVCISGSCLKNRLSKSCSVKELASIHEELLIASGGSGSSLGSSSNRRQQYLLQDKTPFATNYTGFQFNKMVGQLGDGRCCTIVEGELPSSLQKDTEEGSVSNPPSVLTRSKRGREDEQQQQQPKDQQETTTAANNSNNLFEIQLKGGGIKTPFSRSFDGKLVYQSAVKEFLAAELMAEWGVKTSRCLALWYTPADRAVRSNMSASWLPTGVLARVMTSSLRVGTFENLYYTGKHQVLKDLVDYTIRTHWPRLLDTSKATTATVSAASSSLSLSSPTTLYYSWMSLVVQSFGRMVAQWNAVGFLHGVMNTDNFSIHGETIDYGPFTFASAEHYDPELIHNDDDAEGIYRLGLQREAGKKNAERFCLAVSPVLGVTSQSSEVEQKKAQRKFSELLKEYDNAYELEFRTRMMAKLGFTFDNNATTTTTTNSDSEGEEGIAAAAAADALVADTLTYLDSTCPPLHGAKDTVQPPKYFEFFSRLAKTLSSGETGSSGCGTSMCIALAGKTSPSPRLQAWVDAYNSFRSSSTKAPGGGRFIFDKEVACTSNPSFVPSLEFMNSVAAASLQEEEEGGTNFDVVADALKFLRKKSRTLGVDAAQKEREQDDQLFEKHLMEKLAHSMPSRGGGDQEDCGCG